MLFRFTGIFPARLLLQKLTFLHFREFGDLEWQPKNIGCWGKFVVTVPATRLETVWQPPTQPLLRVTGGPATEFLLLIFTFS